MTIAKNETVAPSTISGARPVRAPRGSSITCRGWEQEAAMRMLMNNLDAEVAERPDDLVVYTKVAQSVAIPVIGIGAGAGVDGQVLVTHDMLGMTHEFNPRFLRRYLNLYDSMGNAFKQYIADVKSKNFPSEKEQY